MYFVNDNGKIIKTKHQLHCKCHYCHRSSTSSFTFTNLLLIVILGFLFYTIWNIIMTMNAQKSSLIPPTPSQPIVAKNNLL